MFSCTAAWLVTHIPKWRKNTTSIPAEISTKFCSTIKTGSTYHIRQVNVVNGGYIVMLAVVLSFCPSVRSAHSVFRCKYLENGLR